MASDHLAYPKVLENCEIQRQSMNPFFRRSTTLKIIAAYFKSFFFYGISSFFLGILTFCIMQIIKVMTS